MTQEVKVKKISELEVAKEISDTDLLLVETSEGTKKIPKSAFLENMKGDKGDTPDVSHLLSKMNANNKAPNPTLANIEHTQWYGRFTPETHEMFKTQGVNGFKIDSKDGKTFYPIVYGLKPSTTYVFTMEFVVDRYTDFQFTPYRVDNSQALTKVDSSLEVLSGKIVATFTTSEQEAHSYRLAINIKSDSISYWGKPLVVEEENPNKEFFIEEYINTTGEKVARLKSLEEAFLPERVNLFDQHDEDNVKGTFITGDTTNSTVSSAGMSHFIKVKEGAYYTYDRYKQVFGGNTAYQMFDKDKQLLGHSSATAYEDYQTIYVTPNSGTVFVRVNVAASEFANFSFVEGKEYGTSKSSLNNAYYLNESQINQVREILKNTKSTLDGKILAVQGDSICQGVGSTGGYGKIIADRNNMTLQNLGISGGTISAETYTSSGSARHWICRNIDQLREDADFILLEGGVNDASLNVPLGTVSSGYSATLDDTTFCGAFESMVKQALTRFKGKKLGYIFVHKMTDKFDSRYPDNHYHKAKEICEKWGVPYLDLNNECPPLCHIPSLRSEYTHNNDGWHPNSLGYEKYYCDKIEAFLLRL